MTATVAGLVSIPTLAQAAATPKRQAKNKPKAKPDEARWMGDLDGRRFAGCLVHEVSAVKHGSVAVTLSDSAGAFFVVDILRHDAATPGVARAGSLAVYMKIDGQGVPTKEEHGLAAMALAAEVGRRAEAGLAAPVLFTLNERAADRRSA